MESDFDIEYDDISFEIDGEDISKREAKEDKLDDSTLSLDSSSDLTFSVGGEDVISTDTDTQGLIDQFIGPIDDVDVLNFELPDLEFGVDGEIAIENLDEEEISASPDILGIEEHDMVAEFNDMMVYFNGVVEELRHNNNNLSINKMTLLDYDLFADYKGEWVTELSRILVDLAEADISAGRPEQKDVAPAIIERLWNTVGWRPTNERAKACNLIQKQYSKLYNIMSTTRLENKHSLADYFDVNRFWNTCNVVNLIVGCFGPYTGAMNTLKGHGQDFYTDRRKTKLIRCVVDRFNGPMNAMTYDDWVRIIFDILAENRVTLKLGLTEDNVRNFSFGEIIRRLLQGDLESDGMARGIFNILPAERDIEPDERCNVVKQFLTEGIHHDLLSCDLIYLIIRMVSRFFPSEIELDAMLYLPLYSYIVQYLEQPEFTRITYYYNVVDQGDGYELKFPLLDRQNNGSAMSDDLLCMVVADQNTSYTVVLGTVGGGYFIMPPFEVVSTLSGYAKSTRYNIDAGLNNFVQTCYVPTLKWLEDQNFNVIVEQSKAKVGDSHFKSDPYLADIVFNYGDDFYSTDSEHKVVRFNIEVGALTCLQVGDRYIVGCIGSESDDGYTFTPINGSCVDSDGLNLQYLDENGAHSLYLEPGSYKVEELAHLAATSRAISYCANYFGQSGISSLNVDRYNKLRSLKAVCMRLCRSTGNDFEVLLQKAQQIIYTDLYDVCDIGVIESLMASKILDVYSTITGEEVDDEKVSKNFKNNYNMETVAELGMMLWGAQNPLLGVKVWGPAEEKLLQDAFNRVRPSISEVCTFWDGLNLNILALQAVSKHEGVEIPEARAQYFALRNVPGLHERISYLELCMVATMLSFEARDDVDDLLRRNITLAAIFRDSAWNAATIDQLSSFKRRALGTSDFEPPMRLSTQFSKQNGGDSLFKHFLIARDFEGLQEELKGKPEYKELLDELAAENGKSRRWIHREALTKLFYDSLLAEVNENGQGTELLTADLVVDFARFLYTFKEDELEDCEKLSDSEFLPYVNSFTVSYCPVADEIVARVDGGESLDVIFLSASDMFLLPTDFKYVEGTLADLRHKLLV